MRRSFLLYLTTFTFALILSIVLLEVGSRIFLAKKFSTASFKNISELIHAYYPNLKAIQENELTKEDGVFDILLLGGSVLHPNNGEVEKELQNKIKAMRPNLIFKIHNAAALGHTSRDSKFKMDVLSQRHFDVVIFYHAINDSRANNCKAEVFKKKYTHFKWYDEIEGIIHRTGNEWSTIPVAYNYFYINGHQRVFPRDYIPRGLPYKGWAEYGNKIKTVESFEANVESVHEQVTSMGSTLLLPTFTYWLKDNSSFENFEKTKNRDERSRMPVKIWGKHKNVVKAIDFHNQVILENADKYENISVFNLHSAMPKGDVYFDDICHLSKQGSIEFATFIAIEIGKILNKN